MNDDILRHPSYGMVGFHRITGCSRRLFGSTLETHYHTIRLSIHEAEMRIDRHLHMERARATGQIIEVEMSAAQFAELLTSMNIGDGVPCTITRRMGVGMIESPPDVPVESANVRTDFAAKMGGARPDLEQRAKALLDLLPASFNKGTRRQIEIALGNIVERVAGSATFALDQFQEATSRVVTAAKAEVDAVVTHVVQATGIKALREMQVRGEVLTLPEHVEPKEEG